jgi:hypothetical protein
MTVTVTHRKVSTLPAGSNPNLVYGPHWNETHVVNGLDEAIGDAVSGAVAGYDSVAAVQAATIGFSTNYIRTNSYAGNGGGALYKKVVSAPSHAGKIQSADGAWWEIDETDIDVRMLGAIGNEIANDTTAINNCLAAAHALGARAVFSSGTYMVDEIRLNPTHDFSVMLAAGAAIKGNAGFGTAVVEFDGIDSDSLDRPKVMFVGGGTIDNSLRTYSAAVASGTGLVFKRISEFVISGIRFQSRAPVDIAGVITKFGDSGIATETCERGVIDSCTFYDQPDIGIYLTGGGSIGPEDNFGDIKVVNCHFERCAIAVTARRQVGRTIVANNTVYDCNAGIQSAPAKSGSTWVPFQQTMVVIGNVGEKLTGAFVDLRLAGPGSLVVGNTVTDWSMVSASAGYGILGCNGVTITGNAAYAKDAVSVTRTAFSIGDHSYGDSSEFTVQGQNNHVAHNTIIGAAIGIRDTTEATPDVITNAYGPNMMIDVADHYNTLGTGPIGGNLLSRNAIGFGVGIEAALATLHVTGKMRFERVGTPAQYTEIESNTGQLDIVSYSVPTSAKGMRFHCTTDATHTTPSGGGVNDIQFTIRNGEKFRIKDANKFASPITMFQNFTDDTTAAAGSIAIGEWYRTGSILKIRVA